MSFACPECGKSLQAKGGLAPGKRIKCPKCATVFAPVEKVEIVEEVDDEPQEEYEERPRRKRRRDREEDDRDRDDIDSPRRKKSKSRKGTSPALLWGLLGGGVFVVIGIIVVVVILLAGGSQHEESMKEMLQILSDLVNAVESVKDQDSARVAGAKIQQVCDRMEGLANKLKAQPKITQAEGDRLKTKYKTQMESLQQRMQKAAFQAGVNSRGDPAFLAAMQRLGRVGQMLQQMGI